MRWKHPFTVAIVGFIVIFVNIAQSVGGEVQGSLRHELTEDEYLEYDALEEFKMEKMDLGKYKAMIDTVFRSICPFSRTGKQHLPECDACTASIRLAIESLLRQDEWAILMADAAVKPHPGFLLGSFAFISAYDECIKIPPYDLDAVPDVKARYPEITRHGITVVKGAYCGIKLKVTKNPDAEHKENVTGLAAMMQKEEKGLKDVQEFMDEFPGFLGICVPSPCTKLGIKELQRAISFFLKSVASKNSSKLPVNLTAEVISCKTSEQVRRIDWTVSAKLALSFMMILIILVLVGTGVDIVRSIRLEKPASKSDMSLDEIMHSYDFEMPTRLGELFRSMSMYTSFRRLMDTRDPWKNHVSCAHGLRMLSLIWVIIGSTAVYRAYNLTTNLKEMQESLHHIHMQFALNSAMAIDSILALCGLLMAFTLGNRITVKKATSEEAVAACFGYFFHRIVRTVPLYIGLLWILSTMFSGMGGGPTWDIEKGRFLDQCPSHWWWNLLHINNMFPNQQQCMPHTWLYAYLMQATLIGIIVLLFWRKNPRLSFFFMILLVVISTIMTFAKNFSWDLGPTILLREHRPGTRHGYMDSIAMKVYTRGAPFFIGFIAGLVIARKNIKLTKKTTIIAWVLILTILVGIANATFYWNLGTHKPGRFFAASYDALHRLIWAIAVSFFVVCCHWKKGGFLNIFMSWSGWIPLNRLFYAIYLIHPFVIFHGNGTTKMVQYYSFRLLVSEILWNLIVSIILSIFAHIFIESPFLALERFLVQVFQGGDDAESNSYESPGTQDDYIPPSTPEKKEAPSFV